MKLEIKDQLKEKMQNEIAILEQGIAEFQELTKPISPANAIGRVSRMDAINNKSINETALAKKRERLYKLEMALSKVDGSNFGLCAYCMQPINPERLFLIPECTTCVRCASFSG